MRVVIVHGREPFLLAEATRRLVDVLQAEHGEIDRRAHDGDTAELADVLDELRSFALFQGHKLVVVDNADRFLAGETGRRRALEAYAESPSSAATLMLRAQGWRPGRLDKLAAVVRCEPLKDREAVAWAAARCPQRYGVRLERPAAALLVERLGPDLGRLDTELAKLAVFVGDKSAIGREDVVELVGRSRQEKAWELQTAIMSGRPAEACVKTRQLLEISRLDTTLVMWAISDLLRRLHTAAQLLRQGERPQTLRGALRLWGPTGDRIIEVAGRGEPQVFARLLQRAVQTDFGSKSGLGQPERNLEALTLQVTDTIGCL